MLESGSTSGAGSPQVPGYAVQGRLGEGASSAVWRARREVDGLTVALKVLRPADGQVEAGLREAGLLARLRHPHLVHLHDVVPVPDEAGGRTSAVALAMQLAPGGCLGQLLSRRRMLSPGEVVTVLQPICSVLTELHGQGVVHGDLSVGNIVFLRDGMPLLTDLGASRILGDLAGGVQATDAASGMVAPEVLEGFAPTAESDCYALGALAWRCLVGEPPGPGFSRPPLAECSPELPEGLVAMIERALAPDPEQRPDPDEIAAALVAAARPEPIEVAPDADPGHGLTARLRQQAREDEAEDPRASTRRGRRRARRSDSRSDTRRGGQRRPDRPGRPRPWLERLHAAGVTLGILVVLALVGTLVWGMLPWANPGQAGDAPRPDRSPSPTRQAVLPSREVDAATEAPVALPAPTGDAAVPGEDLVQELVQDLVDVRGDAWEQRDPELLGQAMAPGSPALVAEAGNLARVQEQGVSYADVTFRVDEARVLEATEDRLRVQAVVSRAPLVAFAADGERSRTRSRTDQVVLVLARATEDEPWLFWSWGQDTDSRSNP